MVRIQRKIDLFSKNNRLRFDGLIGEIITDTCRDVMIEVSDIPRLFSIGREAACFAEFYKLDVKPAVIDAIEEFICQ